MSLPHLVDTKKMKDSKYHIECFSNSSEVSEHIYDDTLLERCSITIIRLSKNTRMALRRAKC